MNIYIYIHIMFGDVLCLVSQSISPLLTSQTKYQNLPKNCSRFKFSQASFSATPIRSFFLGFFLVSNPALCKVWGFNAPAPLRGAVYRCQARHRALIFHLWTSQRLDWSNWKDLFNITSPFIVRKSAHVGMTSFFFPEGF